MPRPCRTRIETMLRTCTGLRAADRAEEGIGVVLRSPDLVQVLVDEHDRRIVDQAGGGEAVVQGRAVDERLETGARLALGLDRAVVVALLEGEAADQRADRPVLRVKEISALCAAGICTKRRVPSSWRCTRIWSPGWATSAGWRGIGPMLLLLRKGRAHFMLSQVTASSLPSRVITMIPLFSTWVTIAGSRPPMLRCWPRCLSQASRVWPGRRVSGPR